MNESEIIAALRSYWISSWESPELVLWDDETTPAPVGVYSLRVTLRSSASQRITIGRTREENRGMIMISLFGPRDEGPGALERLSSKVAAFWRAFRHSRIILDAPSVVGLPAEGAFNRHLVTLGWRGDMRL